MSEQIVCDKCGKVWETFPAYDELTFVHQDPVTGVYIRYHGHLCYECGAGLIGWLGVGE